MISFAFNFSFGPMITEFRSFNMNLKAGFSLKIR